MDESFRRKSFSSTYLSPIGWARTESSVQVLNRRSGDDCLLHSTKGSEIQNPNLGGMVWL